MLRQENGPLPASEDEQGSNRSNLARMSYEPLQFNCWGLIGIKPPHWWSSKLLGYDPREHVVQKEFGEQGYHLAVIQALTHKRIDSLNVEDLRAIRQGSGVKIVGENGYLEGEDPGLRTRVLDGVEVGNRVLHLMLPGNWENAVVLNYQTRAILPIEVELTIPAFPPEVASAST